MKKIGAVAIILAVTLLLGSCSIFNLFEGKGITERFDNYIMADFAEDFAALVAEYEIAKENKDRRGVKDALEKLEDFEEMVEEENKWLIETIISDMESADTSSLAGKEKKELEKAIKKARELKEKEKYKEAYFLFTDFAYLAPGNFKAENTLDITVNQVDCSDYPTVRLFLRVTDENGETPKKLDKKYFTVLDGRNPVRRQITSVMQLDKNEGLSINMVADSSGSMQGSSMDRAKSTMRSFLGEVQYEYGDTVALTVFANTVEKQTAFTSDYSSIKKDIGTIEAHGGTALYDTLYTAVQYTARQNGARCVIAFTDGHDEHSEEADEDDVIRIANDYKIPIFIIGIGSEGRYAEVEKIAERTGGFYTSVASSENLKEIYNAIYRQQKEMYVIEYTAEEDEKYVEHTPTVEFFSGTYGGASSYYAFTPSYTNPSTYSEGGSDIETAIKNYLESYVRAMNESDSTHMLPYVIADSPIYNMQKNYIKNKYREELLSFYITGEIKMEGENSCVVSVHEVYNVETPERPFSHHEQEATYRIKKDSDGKWKMYEFVGAVKNHL